MYVCPFGWRVEMGFHAPKMPTPCCWKWMGNAFAEYLPVEKWTEIREGVTAEFTRNRRNAKKPQKQKIKNTAWKEQAVAVVDNRFHFRSFCYNFALLHSWSDQRKHNQEYPTDRLYHILYTPPPSAKELTVDRPELPADCEHAPAFPQVVMPSSWLMHPQ